MRTVGTSPRQCETYHETSLLPHTTSVPGPGGGSRTKQWIHLPLSPSGADSHLAALLSPAAVNTSYRCTSPNLLHPDRGASVQNRTNFIWNNPTVWMLGYGRWARDSSHHSFTIVTSQFYMDGHHVSPDNYLIPEYSVDISTIKMCINIGFWCRWRAWEFPLWSWSPVYNVYMTAEIWFWILVCDQEYYHHYILLLDIQYKRSVLHVGLLCRHYIHWGIYVNIIACEADLYIDPDVVRLFFRLFVLTLKNDRIIMTWWQKASQTIDRMVYLLIVIWSFLYDGSWQTNA